MDCFSLHVRKKIAKAGYKGLADALDRIHKWLRKTRMPTIAINQHSELSVTVGHCFVIWQVQLHRVERLMVSTGSAIEHDDTYGFAVLIRAIVESTVVLAALCGQMHAFARGKLAYADFDQFVTALLVGSRSEHQPDNPRATNILTLIPKADRFVDSEMSMNIRSPLSTIYGALSEYAHPNMQSNNVAIATVDAEAGIYRFRHDATITDAHIALLGTLNVSATIFECVSGFFLTMIAERFQGEEPAKTVH